MRRAAALALASVLAACSPAPSREADQAGEDAIDCAVNGAAGFSQDCSVERGQQDGQPLLVVRHPDGGFRRFKVLDGGRSLAPADGANALAIARTADRVDVSVDGDRYRFPASVLSNAASR